MEGFVEHAVAQAQDEAQDESAYAGAHPRPPSGPPRDADAFGPRVDDGLHQVRDTLDRLVREHRAEVADRGEACAQLWDDLGAGLGGKLVRPRLVLAAYLGLGGGDAADAVAVAAATEVLHAAMLVHDDLLDHDEVRRGRPNVAGATRRRLTAAGWPVRVVDDQVTAAAVLAGDAGIAAAFGLVAAAPAAPAVRVRLVELLAASIRTTVAGELLDVRAELSAPYEVEALAVAELKTADYSGRMPLLAGGLLAGAGPDQLAALGEIGLRLGVAYQLVDDELGVFGDPAVTGKSVLSDLRDGKRTALLRTTWELADEAGRDVLRRHIGHRDLDELGAARVRAVMRATGAVESVRAVARAATRSAVELAGARLPATLADHLGTLVGDLTERGR
ncbi:MAG: polyprenyl synthetase family protein [Actinobacteria bacterium]|nr:polyprenyl synthetase family protein [Actinomycetota bacterium]